MTATAFTPDEVDRHVDALRTGAQDWVERPVAAKIALLREVRTRVHEVAPHWVRTACDAKGIAGTPLEGEEWISGPYAVLYALNRFIDTLDQIDRTGAPYVDPRRVRTRPDGTCVVDVFPNDLYDRLLLGGVRAEVWMQAGVTPDNLPSTMGIWYRRLHREPRVALVLGAGNIASIAPLDVLYKLIADGAACVLKMNPVNAYLGPLLEIAFEPLVQAGVLALVYGGADVGKYLCAHPNIDEIHITGSDKTHDAIVFGDGPDGADRKRRNDPVLTKPITSELGNVSPTIVVGGLWSDADFRFQAEQIATQKLHNNGFNCIASQVLILPADWDGTPKLLAHLERVLTDVHERPAYYPGAADRRERIVRGRSDVRAFRGATLVHARAGNEADTVFGNEAFANVLAYTMLPGDTGTYLDRAVTFANETLWGTLGANIIVHPKTMREHARALDRAIARLEYGTIGVNAWTGVGYFIAETPWGAYPGHTIEDIRSGIGVVHNSHLFSESQKSVVYAPFAPFPKPPWFVTNRMAAQTGRALCDFEAKRNPLTAANVALRALRA